MEECGHELRQQDLDAYRKMIPEYNYSMLARIEAVRGTIFELAKIKRAANLWDSTRSETETRLQRDGGFIALQQRDGAAAEELVMHETRVAFTKAHQQIRK
jgi:hypothetical protein